MDNDWWRPSLKNTRQPSLLKVTRGNWSTFLPQRQNVCASIGKGEAIDFHTDMMPFQSIPPGHDSLIQHRESLLACELAGSWMEDQPSNQHRNNSGCTRRSEIKGLFTICGGGGGWSGVRLCHFCRRNQDRGSFEYFARRRVRTDLRHHDSVTHSMCTILSKCAYEIEI